MPFRVHGAAVGQGGEEPGGVDAVHDRDERLFLPDVGQEHGGRVSLPGFQGMHAGLSLDVVDIQEDLGGFTDAGDGLEGVAAPKDGEIGHRVELEEVRAGDHEKIADHQVRCPREQQIREGIEDVEHVPPLLADDVVNLGGEGFEARVGVELVDGDLPGFLEQGRVAGKPHVDDPLVVVEGLPDEGGDKTPVVLDGIDLQDHVVACLQVAEDLVEPLDACADTGKRFHRQPLR
ncbi:MAG: hypothetical protein A4E73_01984 [Syntrophaceae bacterium PtaU1.Bin231]|nr:MAG: hypothetical protein A4E73_01984 [Syntrophaceae bacterium PtaU1.Bin231]